MGFLDMGTMEILLILVVALIIWGPHKIPEIARTLGKTVRALRKATYDLTATVTRELELEEKKHSPQPEADNGTKSKDSSDTDKAKSKESPDTDKAKSKDSSDTDKAEADDI